MPKKTIVLGPEYDANLRKAVLTALRELEAHPTKQWSGHGGSQEFEVLHVVIDGKTLTVEAETYVGLSVRGDAELVERVRQRVSELIG